MFPPFMGPFGPMPLMHRMDIQDMMEEGLVTVPYRVFERMQRDIGERRREDDKQKLERAKRLRELEQRACDGERQANHAHFVATTFSYHLFAIFIQQELDNRNIKLRVDMVAQKDASKSPRYHLIPTGKTAKTKQKPKYAFRLGYSGETNGQPVGLNYDKWLVWDWPAAENDDKPIVEHTMLKTGFLGLNERKAVIQRLEELAEKVVAHYIPVKKAGSSGFGDQIMPE